MAKAWGCGVKIKESHLFPQSNGNASPTREVREGRMEGVAKCQMTHHTQLYSIPPAFCPWSILHHCLRTVARSPAAGTLDTLQVAQMSGLNLLMGNEGRRETSKVLNSRQEPGGL